MATKPRIDILTIWWDARATGDLRLDRHGAMQFAYRADWLADPLARPLSQALPKHAAPASDRVCKAVFGGLLPEETQRTAVARALGVSPDNPFRLLEALGGDVAGALSFLPPDMPPIASVAFEMLPAALDDAALAALVARLPLVPMLAGEEGGARLSLAGAQSKLPVLLAGAGDSAGIALPRPGEASTHIIKPEPERFPGLAANEAFCLDLARAIGLDAVHAVRRDVAGQGVLLVTRYDRITDEAGQVRRLHQEDFAQAMAVPPPQKYEPHFRDIFALLRRAANAPAAEILKLLDAALFNLIIGNADAHAKNFSLLYDADGTTRLAPLYDLVSTVQWRGLSPRFAMKYGGAATLEELDEDALRRFAKDAGIGYPFVRRRAGELATLVRNADGKSAPELMAAIVDRAGRLLLKLAT